MSNQNGREVFMCAGMPQSSPKDSEKSDHVYIWLTIRASFLFSSKFVSLQPVNNNSTIITCMMRIFEKNELVKHSDALLPGQDLQEALHGMHLQVLCLHLMTLQQLHGSCHCCYSSDEHPRGTKKHLTAFGESMKSML